MTNCLNKVKRSLGAIAVMVLVVLGSSCTKVDDQIGSNFIPENQLMATFMDTLAPGIITSNFYTDSIISSNTTRYLLGKSYSPTYGSTTAGFLGQYVIYYSTLSSEDAEDENDRFGFNPVIDSLVLIIPYDRAYGDSTVNQTFNIYKVTKRIHKDSTYYTNFDYQNYIDPTPIATFDFASSGDEDADEEMRVKIDPDKLGRSLIDTTGGIYISDSIFLQNYFGFYIAPAESSSQDAAIYSITVANVNMTLHYRVHDRENPTQIKDTLYAVYSFDDNVNYFNSSINTVKHDYTTINTDTTTVQDVTYIQGFGGVATYYKFTEDFVQSLKNLLASHPEYNNIAINQAILYVKMNDPVPDNFKKSPVRIGMYKNYRKKTPIVDYYYEYESSGYTIPYGGYLERSLGYYSMDITTYIARILNGYANTPSGVVLGTTYDTQLGYQEVALQGSGSASPPKIVITYTLIK